MTSARLPLVALSTCATPSMPASVELPVQVAGGVGELGEDEDLLVCQLLRLEQADELLELVVVLGLELPGFFEEADDLVEVEEGLLHHLDDFVFVAAEPGRPRQEILAGRCPHPRPRHRPRPKARADAASRSRAPRRSGASSARAASSRRRSRCDFKERQQLSQQAVAGQLERGDRALEALQELGADQADDLLLAVLLEGIDALVVPL